MAEDNTPPVITVLTDKNPQSKGDKMARTSPPKSERVTILSAVRAEKMRTHGSFSYLRPAPKTVRGSLKTFTIFGAGVNLIDRDDWEWLNGASADGTLNDSHGLIATRQVFLILDGLHFYRDAVKVVTLTGGTIPREAWITQCYSPQILTTWRDQIAAMTAEEFKVNADYSERRVQIENRLKDMGEGKITPPRHISFSPDAGLAAFY
jgi:hypothetical protein